jgi:hypothetical protein
MDQVNALVVPVFHGYWEAPEFPDGCVRRAGCGHYVWVVPAAAMTLVTEYICVDCALMMMRTSKVESRLLPGAMDQFAAESPEMVDELRAFMAKYDIQEG